LPHRNARAQHLDMSRCCDVANFCPLVVNLLYNKLYRIVVSSSVGGVVQHVRITVVRVVKFGTKGTERRSSCGTGNKQSF